MELARGTTLLVEIQRQFN